MSLGQASAWYESSFGEPVDIGEFAATLTELGFVREAGAGQTAAAPVRLRKLGMAAFSSVAWACYAGIVALWLRAAFPAGAILPHPSQIFFTGSLVLVQLVITFGQVPLLFLHEAFHILAGRRLGLPSRLGVSNRLTYIVFETQLNGLMSVPRRARYLPFLAGMLCDCVVFCSLGLVAELTAGSGGSFSLAGRICLALAFTVVMRIFWQFQLYLRTDLYYVFATALNCYDLHDASSALLRNRIWRALRGRPGSRLGSRLGGRLGRRLVDEQQWTEHDRRVGTFYGPFIALGILVMAAITVFGSYPVVHEYLLIIARGFATGPRAAPFWDACVSLTFNIAQVAALIALWHRKRRALADRRPRLLQREAD
jgi:hypothetical protein